MNITAETKIKTRVIDAASRKVVSESPWKKNLILDFGLNALARSTSACVPSQLTSAVRIGSGNSVANSYASGAITFTQAGTTLTASGGFFTAGMVGMLFKWGTGSGGVESYITGFTSATQVTLADSATVGTPEVGTVWNVSQTALETLLYSSSTYETSPGSCGTTLSGNQLTFKRTITFAQQGSPYNVNEIGYFNSIGGTSVYGRIVLGATDVVPTTSFYQVVIEVTFVYSPGSPTAVVNVGTNIDTAGTAMMECINHSNILSFVNTNGTSSSGAPSARLDGSANAQLFFMIASYSQNATPGSVLSVTSIAGPTAAWTYAGTRGRMRCFFNAGVSTNGQTLHGIGFGAASDLIGFDVKLTTPFVLPVGIFLAQTTLAVNYNRTLTN